MKYPHLFNPIQIAGLTIPNRIAMSAMSTHLGSNGFVTASQVAFYRERAQGGVGLLTVEYTCVDRGTGLAEPLQLCLDTPENVAGHARIVDAITATGARAVLQLHHAGRQTSREALGGAQPVAPSPVPYTTAAGTIVPRSLEDAEIHRLIECFRQSAQWAVDAGYQGIELHGAHGYLLGQFLSPYTNVRTDGWGGDFERRLRFPCAVIAAVKSVLGPARPLIWRLSAEEFVVGGLTITDTAALAPRLALAGVDALNVSMGTFDSLEYVVEPMSMKEGWRLPYCRRIRDAVNVPVLASGMVRTPAMAEQALIDGDGDMISLGRPLLADPEWPNKARLGRDSEICPCTTCNWCAAPNRRNAGTACAQNPRAGHEDDPPIPRFGAGRPAAVVGAGPAGIVAALLLDQSGFVVTLFESRDKLGGGLIASATPPHKDKLFAYLEYLKAKVDASNIDVKLGTPATPALLRAIDPALVILSYGAPPTKMGIEGEDGPGASMAYGVLMGDDPVSAASLNQERVAVYGGGETGCETAEFLAERGCSVTLITRSSQTELARNAERLYRKALLQRLAANSSIRVIDHATLTRVTQGEISLRRGESSEQIHVAHTLIAQGQRPVDGMLDELRALGISIAVVGDAQSVRRIGDAVADAYDAVRSFSLAQAMPGPVR
ncbi:MAG TPA: FAD-dependent oxidoreductase [Ramlibacter sp.]|uniref:oxidoreductase n=1 Tax=Ramlibacter sp. TaxID=1917967 RepID=UPI002C288B26|nr:FAD-dependent oxidoreductase [Ramlibacter sp.]HVZ45509.1 FAD-dependent oxidoreductase [Ramlibacter sp.]